MAPLEEALIGPVNGGSGMIGSATWTVPDDTTGVAISRLPAHKAYKSPAPMASTAKNDSNATLFPTFSKLLTSYLYHLTPPGQFSCAIAIYAGQVKLTDK